MLENKLGIGEETELEKAEERISKKRAAELFDRGILDTFETGTFKGLCQIHEYLFSDIYGFAGKIRTVNLAKSNFCFAPARYLRETVENIEKMPEDTFDEIMEKYVEMNVAHPFREGNGRSGRFWIDRILKERLGLVVDWSRVGKEDYLSAMEQSPIGDREIKTLLYGALTDQTDDRAVYMKGLDASYWYEDFESYRAEDLAGS